MLIRVQSQTSPIPLTFDVFEDHGTSPALPAIMDVEYIDALGSNLPSRDGFCDAVPKSQTCDVT